MPEKFAFYLDEDGFKEVIVHSTNTGTYTATGIRVHDDGAITLSADMPKPDLETISVFAQALQFAAGLCRPCSEEQRYWSEDELRSFVFDTCRAAQRRGAF